MELTIYHTNDLHSSFAAMSAAAACLKAHKKPGDLYFDCGDLCDLRDVMVQGSRGAGALRLLAGMEADAMALGNNEIDLEYDAMQALSGCGVALVSCNVTDNDGAPVPGIRKSIVLESGGIRVLVLGISPYYRMDLSPDGYNIFFRMGNLMTTDPVPALRQELASHSGSYDMCILLSHSGYEAEKWLLQQFPEIDLCLGGHSHTACCEPRYNQAGGFGRESFLGAVHLTVTGGRPVITKQALIPLPRAADPDFEQALSREQALSEALMSRPLYSIEPLGWSATEESPLTNFIADALYRDYPCELAFINAGIVEGPAEGAVSRMSVLLLSPSKLNPTRFPLTGRQLREAIRHCLDRDFALQSGAGPGVRGSVLGTLGFSHNVRIRREPLAVWVDGRELDDEKVYLCTADDSLQRGTGYTELRTPEQDAEFFPGFIRDLLLRTLSDEDLRRSAAVPRLMP